MQLDCTSKDVDRFWRKVKRTENDDECWEYQGTPSQKYGLFTLKGKQFRVNRFAYMLEHGSCNEALLVCHECDNPRCVNPKHLFLGTSQVNIDDCIAKQRHTRGEVQGLHKLTVKAVNEIRVRYANGGITQTELAEEFGVKQQVVSAEILFKTWK